MADTPVTPTPVPAWPTAPQRTDAPATFVTLANAWVAATPTQTTAMNTLGTNVKFNADSAFASAGEAVASVADAAAEVALAAVQVGLAEDSAAESSDYAGESLASSVLSAGSANLAGAWADQTGAAAPPYSVTHIGRIWVLLNSLGDVTASEPGVTADWLSVGSLALQVRTSNVILAADDYGANIQYTGAGGFTQTFQPVATFGSGFYIYLRNDTTGNLTLDPDGSETIDGLTSYIMYPGEMRFIQLNAAGTALVSIVMRTFEVTFDSSGTFTTPPGYKAFAAKVWSAAGSGERTNNAGVVSKGGGGGGCFEQVVPSGAVGSSETITVGAGGAAVTTVASGNLGGQSSFGTLLVVYPAPSAHLGGSIGYASSAQDNSTSAVASFAGAGTAGGNTIWGGAGGSGTQGGFTAAGNSVNGGAGGGGLSDAAVLGAAGLSIYGGNGGAASSASNGTAGAQPGGGGGATQTGTQSGAGGDGRVVIRGNF
jgi:hypothetical protein